MIHALLFVTQNNRDRDGHGPEFCKHMNRINKASGTKITVSKSFRTHINFLVVTSDQQAFNIKSTLWIFPLCLATVSMMKSMCTGTSTHIITSNQPSDSLFCHPFRSTTVSKMKLMCTGSTGGSATDPASTASPTLALWREPWTVLRLLRTPGGRTTRGHVGGLTPRSKSLKDTARKARRMLKRMERPQRIRPHRMKSLLAQLRVSFSAVCSANVKSHIYTVLLN